VIFFSKLRPKILNKTFDFFTPWKVQLNSTFTFSSVSEEYNTLMKQNTKIKHCFLNDKDFVTTMNMLKRDGMSRPYVLEGTIESNINIFFCQQRRQHINETNCCNETLFLK